MLPVLHRRGVWSPAALVLWRLLRMRAARHSRAWSQAGGLLLRRSSAEAVIGKAVPLTKTITSAPGQAWDRRMP